MCGVEQRNALSRAVSPNMATKYILTFYEKLKELVGSHDREKAWIEKGDGNIEYCEGFIHLSPTRRLGH